MLDDWVQTSEAADDSTPRSARQEKRMRNAEARRKLEALRELKVLRRQLTEVWQSSDNV
jgi:hypothetical protein